MIGWIVLVEMEISTKETVIEWKTSPGEYHMYVFDIRSMYFDLTLGNQELAIRDAMSYASEIGHLHMFLNKTFSRSTDMQVRIDLRFSNLRMIDRFKSI